MMRMKPAEKPLVSVPRAFSATTISQANDRLNKTEITAAARIVRGWYNDVLVQ